MLLTGFQYGGHCLKHCVGTATPSNTVYTLSGSNVDSQHRDAGPYLTLSI